MYVSRSGFPVPKYYMYICQQIMVSVNLFKALQRFGEHVPTLASGFRHSVLSPDYRVGGYGYNVARSKARPCLYKYYNISSVSLMPFLTIPLVLTRVNQPSMATLLCVCVYVYIYIYIYKIYLIWPEAK
jgi:hypothetical protein